MTSRLDASQDSNNSTNRRLLSKRQIDVIIQEKEPITTDEYIKQFRSSFNETKINLQFLDSIDQKKSEFGKFLYIFEITIRADNQLSSVNQKWTIIKRFKDILDAAKKCEKLLKSHNVQNLKRWDPPDDREPKMAAKSIRNRLTYLIDQLNRANLIYQPLHAFLEISSYNAKYKIVRYKEGYLEKQHGGHFSENTIMRFINKYCPCRKVKRWFIVTNDGILYCNSINESNERCLALYDQFFNLEYGRAQTGNHKTIVLITQTRNLRLTCETLFETCQWLFAINNSMKNCEFMKSLAYKRFLSFAPIRSNCEATFYVDGEDYYTEMYHALNQANREIYITDWFFSPEFYFLRPINDNLNKESRLDLTLKRAGERGVKIYIILYKESEFALPNDSSRVQMYMEKLSPNIKVQRHPNILINYWSHHEKMVVIDQKIVFTGGLDLCFGRYDNQAHKLYDEPYFENTGEFWPGQDFSNARKKDFDKKIDPLRCLIDKRIDYRLPWHDIALKLKGDIVQDVCRHFIQYWNFTNIDAKRAVIKPESMNKKKMNNQDKNINVESKKRNIRKIENFFNQYSRPLRAANTIDGTGNTPYKNLEALTLRRYNNANNDTTDYELFSKNNELKPEDMIKIYMNETFIANNDRKITNSVVTKSDLDDSNSKLDSEKVSVLEDKKSSIENLDNNENEHQENNPSIKKMLVDEIKYIDIEQPTPESQEPKKFLNIKSSSSGLLAPRQKSQISRKASSQVIANKENLGKLISKIIHAAQKVDNEDDKTLNANNPSSMMYDIPSYNIEIESPTPKQSLRPNRYQNETEEDELHLKLAREKVLGTCKCQALRSASSWSIGLKDNQTESSIHVAYVELITHSKHFIYIENQFFMSQNAGNPMNNGVAEALIIRIKEAARAKQNFKVIVVLPLLPAFAGDIEKSSVLLMQLHWEYATISRCEESIYKALKRDPNIPNPEKYIEFYGLRTHAKTNNIPVTEQIYVHSKLMIVDDQVAIMGSANINDRSLLGKRDSEICIVVEDDVKVLSKMNNKEYKASKFAHELRLKIFQEHFGMTKEEVLDPLNSNFLNEVTKRAKTNTEIYREIFKCIPDDNVTKFSEIQSFERERQLDKYDERIKDIKGYVVEFPTNFLSGENLNAFYKEKLILPEIVFT